MGKLTELVSSMLKIGLIGFGGGSALIPIIEKTAVTDKKLVSEEAYEEDVVVASITPGALPVELAGGIGKRIAGTKGLLLSASSMAFPGVFLTLLLISVIPFLGQEVLGQIKFITVGVTAFIICLLTDYIVISVKRGSSKREKQMVIVVMVLVFLLTCGKNLYRIVGLSGKPALCLSTVSIFAMAFFVIFYTNGTPTKVNVIVSAIVCLSYLLTRDNATLSVWVKILMAGLALYGIAKGLKNGCHLQGEFLKCSMKDLAVIGMIVLAVIIAGSFLVPDIIQYAGKGMLSSVMSFGGGDAYLSVADGLFVESGMISEDEFYRSLVPIVNVLPGSILCKTLSGIGYYIGYDNTGNVLASYMIAGVGFLCSVAASCAVISFVGGLYKSVGGLPIFNVIKKVIRPIVSGLLLTVVLSLIYQNIQIGVGANLEKLTLLYMLVIYIMDLLLYYKIKMKNVGIVVISVVMSVVMCNLAVVGVF